MLSEDEWRFYSAIYQALNQVTTAPDPPSREFRYMNDQEFIELAQTLRQQYFKAETT